MTTVKRATSKDVAHLAGVAQATVSYVLNGKGSISAETQERVRRAASELNYYPNLAARAMRTSKTNRIAVVTGVQDYDASPVLSGAIDEASKAGFLSEVYGLEPTIPGQGERIVELVQSGQVAGVLCFAQLDPDLMTKLEKVAPVIRPDTLSANMFNVGELADAAPIAVFVEKLAEQGWHRFLHIGGPSDDSVSASARKQIYLDTIGRLGLESIGEIDGNWSAESGLTTVLALPEQTHPLAIVAANDRIAVGVMRGAHLRGWRIPDDISVTGWNDTEIGAYLNPPLTTVSVNRFEAGRWEMRRLIAAINNDDAPAPPANLNTIVWRGSTGSIIA